jgi:hypothetical protein
MTGGAVIALLVGMAVIGLAIFIVHQYLEQQRREALQLLAGRMGFSYFADAEHVHQATLSQFHLFSQGHARKMSNELRGSIDDVAVAIFDYRYSTGSGRHQRTRRQTVLLLESDCLDLPFFTLRPERLYHKLASALGHQDIDFESHPTFSDAYLLQGSDQERVRTLFGTKALTYYARHPELWTEGEGQQLIYCHAGRRVDPESIQDFVQEGIDVLDLFAERDDAIGNLDLLDHYLEQARSAVAPADSGTGDRAA